MSHKHAYRPDIDGLRAIAVLGVLFYHYGARWLPGGFSGVDVFFVISGFVISAKLKRDIEAGEFSVLRFYDGRIRRILPALLVMLAASLAAGWFLLMPEDYARLGASAAYAAGGLGNLYFFWNTSYFDQAAEMQPLLHTWSLGVEEQFYLLWPPLLFLALTRIKSPRRLVALLSIGTVLAFAYAVWIVGQDPKEAFYLPHPRAWELAIGALVVFLPPVRRALLGQFMAASGVVLIAISFLYITASDPFPGLNAAYACIGAALLVWPKPPTLVGTALSHPPVVGVGLISYSLYLWHWPVLVFFQHYNQGEPPGSAQSIALLVLSLAFAMASYRFIESPFRRQATHRATTRVIAWGVACMGLLALAGFGIMANHGVEQRVSSEARRMAGYIGYIRPSLASICTVTAEQISSGEKIPACVYAKTASSKVLLLGDSNAGHIALALHDSFPAIEFVVITSYGCRPVLDSTGYYPPCIDLMKRAYSDFIPTGHFDAVILAASWINGQWERVPESVEYISHFTNATYIIGQTIVYDADLPDLLTGGLFRASRSPIEASKYDAVEKIDRSMSELPLDKGGQYLPVLPLLCSPTACDTLAPSGAPIQYDTNHFTYDGAMYVVSRLKNEGLLKQLDFNSPQAPIAMPQNQPLSHQSAQ